MKKAPLSGVFAPIVTVFDDRQAIRVCDIEENIRIYNETALSGYMPLGSNGEFQGLTDDESLTVLRAVCRVRAPGKLVVGGCGRESTVKTLELIKKVADEGLDYAFVLPPSYFVHQMTDEGIYRFYIEIADKSPIPIVIYNAPKFSAGFDVSPALASRLSVHPNIAAIKNSSQRPNSDYTLIISAGNFDVIAGNIGNFYSGLRQGALGGVLSTASYLPDYCCALYDLVKSGDYIKAEALNSMLQDVSKHTAGPFGVAGVKCAMDALGMKGGRVRLPLIDLAPEKALEFAAVFSAHGIKAAP